MGPQRVLIALESILLLVGAWGTTEAAKQYVARERTQHRLAHELTQARSKASIANEDAGSPGSESRNDTPTGALVGRVRMPERGLDAMIVEGVDDDVLRVAVGHVPSSAMPGESGRVVLAGHRDSFFRPLENTAIGDDVFVSTRNGEQTFVVEHTEVVSPREVEILRSRGADELVLLTCYPFRWVGPAPRRFVVYARPKPPPVARASARIASLTRTSDETQKSTTSRRPRGGGDG